MKPNGFVLAASMTSQMSIPMAPYTIFSSLTSAIFTLRKMFSRSLLASATRHEERAPLCRSFYHKASWPVEGTQEYNRPPPSELVSPYSVRWPDPRVPVKKPGENLRRLAYSSLVLRQPANPHLLCRDRLSIRVLPKPRWRDAALW